jgi:phage-related protein
MKTAHSSGCGVVPWVLSVREGKQPSQRRANGQNRHNISHNVYYVKLQNDRRQPGPFAVGVLQFARNPMITPA